MRVAHEIFGAEFMAEDTISITVRLPSRLHDRLVAEAERNERDISKQVRSILRAYFEERGGG